MKYKKPKDMLIILSIKKISIQYFHQNLNFRVVVIILCTHFLFSRLNCSVIFIELSRQTKKYLQKWPIILEILKHDFSKGIILPLKYLLWKIFEREPPKKWANSNQNRSASVQIFSMPSTTTNKKGFSGDVGILA